MQLDLPEIRRRAMEVPHGEGGDNLGGGVDGGVNGDQGLCGSWDGGAMGASDAEAGQQQGGSGGGEAMQVDLDFGPGAPLTNLL